MEQSSSSIYGLEGNLGRLQNALRAANHTQNQLFLFVICSDHEKHLGPEGMRDECKVKKRTEFYNNLIFTAPAKKAFQPISLLLPARAKLLVQQNPRQESHLQSHCKVICHLCELCHHNL